RDEEREVGVARPGLLDPAVEFVAQRLPNSESVGTEHDTSAHRRVVGEFGARDYLVVPGGEVDASRGDFLFVLFLCHAMVFQPRTIHCAACQSIAAPPLRARRAPRPCLSPLAPQLLRSGSPIGPQLKWRRAALATLTMRFGASEEQARMKTVHIANPGGRIRFAGNRRRKSGLLML